MGVYRRKAQYHETDQMGIIHHSNYVKWMEEARIDFMKELDLGWTVSPSAICVFAEEKGSKNEPGSTLRLITRILLNRVSGPDQMKIVLHLMDLYRPVAFALDSTGAGQPLVQFLQEEVRKNPELRFALDKIKGYTFSANIVVGLDDTIEIDEYDPNSLKKAEIVRNVKDYSSDMLRKLVDEKRLFFSKKVRRMSRVVHLD